MVRFSLKFSHQTRNIQFVHLVLCCQVAWHLTKIQKFLIGSVNFCFLWHNFQRFTQIHHTADLLCKFCENSLIMAYPLVFTVRAVDNLYFCPTYQWEQRAKEWLSRFLLCPDWFLLFREGRMDSQILEKMKSFTL